MIYTLTINPALDYYLTVQDFEEGNLNCSISSSYSSGGKGINVSRVLRSFNVNSTALGFIGGFSGKEIKNSLSELNISSNFITINDVTRINVKLFDTNRNKETEFIRHFNNISSEEQDKLLNLIQSIVTKNDILVCSGSIPNGMPSNLYKLIANILPKETKIVLDTRGSTLLDNIHNNLLIKPNIHELEEAVKQKFDKLDDIIKMSYKFINNGVENVLVSMGKEGSLLVNKNKVYIALPMNLKVISSVGAGDSMVAGFLAAYSKGQDIKECFKLAVATAAATVSSKGLANEEIALKYLDEVKIDLV